MVRLSRHEQERCRQRRQQWLEKFLPRVHAATRPNSSYLENPEVLELLQHLSDAVNELLMARPLSPLPWLADYLRRACKLAYVLQPTVSEALMLEMHRKRRVIQSALRDTKQDELESKRLIRKIIALEQELKLVGRERRLKKVDHAFLAWEEPSLQSNWSINTSKTESPESSPVERRKSSVALLAASPVLFKTNFELTRKLDEIKEAQSKMHTRLQAMQRMFTDLELELTTRNRFIVKLSESHVTTRTQAIMDGTPVFLNSQKHWVFPGFLLNPRTLSVAELQGLRRAECFLMEKDEMRWKFLLRAQLEYDSATLIASMWRGRRAYHAFQDLLSRRRRAATLIQRNYFHYLFTRAISLPRWCRPGREVIVAPSIAQKCAISFQFYPKRDFPAGNYRREPKGTSIAELMEIARQDEICAGFTTDGAFKRFLPRMLSQLKPMAPPPKNKHDSESDDEEEEEESLTAEDGLYVKVFPKKGDKHVNSAIIVEVPEDRFGLVRVVLDGVAITELVPVTKLTDRWKRIRVKRVKPKQRRKTRAIVFAKGAPSIYSDDNENDSPIVEPGTPDTTYERIESDEEEVEESIEKEWRRQRRLLRRRQQSQERREDGGEEDDAPDYIFEDLVTGRIMRRGHPKNTHSDPGVRAHVIATRKKEYEDEKDRQFEAKKVACAVKIQCAWRCKRAREHFHQMLVLRAKERERERLVDQVSAANAHKKKTKPGKKGGESSFFSRWRK
ncbi:hypothetical protein PHYSODRAFT_523944 [Phytophthora sojae]|uniref:Uncharacterized protein n=1 Tax=Phytophthora sojae (strain P6497) TaxID=1094619 RepID=G5A4V2_PHYSP|nr:hypothetical protein PHYSODRAFT_523944 [Phytophthora sojae]EGZ09702.1 hypothetical protein PHYSODRAFT_523944 [Phytophthora sojae]|eukprot:XP_009534563.1 hypothetical protein PHYSODRAFT_523944 [Phytophthora sojae]